MSEISKCCEAEVKRMKSGSSFCFKCRGRCFCQFEGMYCDVHLGKRDFSNPEKFYKGIPNSSKSHPNNCCTGIKDENGQFICKGDIVEINYFRKGGGALPDQYQSQVTFKNGGFYGGEISYTDIVNNNILAQKVQKLPINFKIIGISENREDKPTHQPNPPLDWEKAFCKKFCDISNKEKKHKCVTWGDDCEEDLEPQKEFMKFFLEEARNEERLRSTEILELEIGPTKYQYTQRDLERIKQKILNPNQKSE